uniref:Axonemal dynein light chain domain containing 1 n=1 Tax=Stegastes partitus TaxID=144197 RepID=A0A3B4ZKJ1_9TELE
PPPVQQQFIPHELLVGFTSTVCNRSTLGQTGRGVTRPDPVWHHPLGRKKYKHFLEQPTSLTGAGRSLSQRLQCGKNIVHYYTEKKSVECQQGNHKSVVIQTCVSPVTRRPSGRLEVVQLMTVMDDMLEKAGVDQQSEELTELSELVKVEQNIYNIVFHELIRQVSVGCAERGQLLAKLRQRYQSLLDRIPRRLKALHTEVVAQRALDRRLTEEIHRIKTSIQQLSTYVGQGRTAGLVGLQCKSTICDLPNDLCAPPSVVQGYHELYELQRARLEAQLLQMTEDRDCWSQLTFCLALKVCEAMASFFSFSLTHFSLTLLTQQGIAKWLSFCTTKNK